MGLPVEFDTAASWINLNPMIYLKPSPDPASTVKSENVPCPDLIDLYDRLSPVCIYQHQVREDVYLLVERLSLKTSLYCIWIKTTPIEGCFNMIKLDMNEGAVIPELTMEVVQPTHS
jgi:hypothetical protein